MLLGQDCVVDTIVGGNVSISSIKNKLNDVIIEDQLAINILSIKHHKKFKVMIKLILEDDSYVIVGKNTYLQVVEEHDIGRILEAKDAYAGQIICPPIPNYVDKILWASSYGKCIKAKQTVLYKASTVVFDNCDYVTISGIPILHDNYEFRKIRRIAKRSNSIANLLLKAI
jgi:hypothetical protein